MYQSCTRPSITSRTGVTVAVQRFSNIALCVCSSDSISVFGLSMVIKGPIIWTVESLSSSIVTVCACRYSLNHDLSSDLLVSEFMQMCCRLEREEMNKSDYAKDCP